MVRVLGRCEVELGDKTVALNRKQAELFGLLAYRRSPLSRAQVASILWPDHPEADARHNLRQTLLALRSRLGGAKVLRDDEGVLALAVSTDLDASEAAWNAGEAGSSDDLSLLAGVHAEWLDAARADIDRRRVEAALRMGEASLPHRPDRALALASMAIARAPEMESPRSLAVRAHLAKGDRASALREIEAFETTLGEFMKEARSGLRALVAPTLPLDIFGVDLALLSGPARLRLVLAAIPALRHRPAVARAALDTAWVTGHEGLSAGERARAEATRANLALECGDQIAAEAAGRRALALAETAPAARAAVLGIWARVLFRTFQVDEALEATEEAKELAKANPDPEALMRALWARGAILTMALRLSESEADLREAVRLARSLDDRWAVATIRHNLAVALLYGGRLEAAVEEYEDALREAPPEFDANLRLGLGRGREAQGRWREASELYGMAAERLREEGRPFLLAQALTARAGLAALRGDLSTARDDYHEAIALRRTVGDRLGLMSASRGLGKAAYAAGRLRAAERDLRESLRYTYETGEPTAGASARFLLARVLAEAGKPDEARVEARRARRVIASLSADAAALTGDDTLSLEAVDRLIASLSPEGECVKTGREAKFLTAR